MAVDEVPAVTQEGDAWVADIPMKEDAMWSDGEPITAEDYVFTWNTARDFNLGANWIEYVRAASRGRPRDRGRRVGAGRGHRGRGGGRLHGQDHLEPATSASRCGVWATARTTCRSWRSTSGRTWWTKPRPARTRWRRSRQPSGAGDPASGPIVYDTRQEGAFARNVANDTYFGKGQEITSRGESEATYTDGPYLADSTLQFYGSQDAAVLALADGEVDYLLNRSACSAVGGIRSRTTRILAAVINPTNGYRYLAFNLTRPPMSDQAFRYALGADDRQGVRGESVSRVWPSRCAYRFPRGTKWYNEEVANEIASQYEGKTPDQRLNEAVALLKEAGYTWEKPSHR